MMKLRKKGFVFISTLALSTIMVIVAVAGSKMLLQDTHMVQRLKYGSQAQYLAEAGINIAMGSLVSSFNTAAFPMTGTLGGGNYSVTLTQSGTRYLLTSTGTATRGTGTSDDVVRVSTLEVQDLTPTCMNYILSAGNEVKLKGGFVSITDVNGSVHGNSAVRLSTGLLLGYVEVSETATYTTSNVYIDTGIILTWVRVGSTTFGSGVSTTRPAWVHTPVAFPTFDYSYYISLATAGGGYYSSNQTFNNATLNPTGNITYVNGTATFSGTCHIYGGLVANSIVLNSGAKVYQHVSGTVNVIAARAGNIDVNDGTLSVENALVYASGDFRSRKLGAIITITGVITATGNINLTDYICYITYNHASPSVVFGSTVSMAKVVSWNR